MTSRATSRYMSLPYNPALKRRARELRKAGNLAEALLWNQLKKAQINGRDFDRQKIIGNYIVDFYCAAAALVVEVDGVSHDGRQEYDAERDRYLKGLGLEVLRFTDKEVKTNMEGVVMRIKTTLADGIPPENHPGPTGHPSTGGE